MSWLDDLFGGGGKSDAWYKAQERQQADRDADNARKAQILQQQLQSQQDARDSAAGDSAYDTGKNSAYGYFSNRGVDPSQFGSDIDAALASVKGSIPAGTTNPGAYYSGVGESVYNDLQNALRTRSLAGIDAIAPSGFENTRIADTADDQIIEDILKGGRDSADQYVKNLLGRGVITNVGYNAAEGDLDAQTAKQRGLLQELGNNILSGGREKLLNIANQGRTAASGLTLGQNFDAGQYGSQIDKAFDDFMSGLGDTFKAQAPTSIFDTSGLAVRAGAAQGAGNNAFKPKAVAGVFGNEDDEDQNRQNTVF